MYFLFAKKSHEFSSVWSKRNNENVLRVVSVGRFFLGGGSTVQFVPSVVSSIG